MPKKVAKKVVTVDAAIVAAEKAQQDVENLKNFVSEAQTKIREITQNVIDQQTAIASLNNLIDETKTQIGDLTAKTKSQKIAEFRESNVYKSLVGKIALVKKSIKGKHEQTLTFTVTIKCVAKVDESELDSCLTRGYLCSDFVQYETSGKIVGKLTKDQRDTLQSSLDDVVSGICDDGVSELFPDIGAKFDGVEESLEKEIDLYNSELRIKGFSASELN